VARTRKDEKKRNPHYNTDDTRWMDKGGPHKLKKVEPKICPMCWAQLGVMEYCDFCDGIGEVDD